MTEPCPHPNSWFSRSLCSLDDWMHKYCTECQDPLDGECGDRAASIREMKPGPVETPGTEAGPVTAGGDLRSAFYVLTGYHLAYSGHRPPDPECPVCESLSSIEALLDSEHTRADREDARE